MATATHREDDRVMRATAVAEIRARFVDRGFPRLVMMVILVAAAGAAFLASYVMLRSGVRSMALRYPAAALVGYGALLVVFRLWLSAAVRRLGRGRKDEPSVLDVIPDGLDVPLGWSPDTTGTPAFSFGGSGGFSGGGAERTWGEALLDDSSRGGGSASSGDGAGGFDLDDGWLIVIPLIAAAAIVIAAATVVSSAPVLLAELLLDGLVAAGIYRRLRHTDNRGWLAGALRRTWRQALGVIAIAGIAGWIIQRVAPATVSIGDLWR